MCRFRAARAEEYKMLILFRLVHRHRDYEEVLVPFTYDRSHAAVYHL